MHAFRSLLFAFTLMLPVASFGATQTPEDACRTYYTALQEQGLGVVPEYMHPDELARFKSMLMPIFQTKPNSKDKEFMAAVFGASATPTTVAALPPVELMRAVMRLVSKKMDAVNISFDSVTILGSVTEGDLAHVVVRSKIGSGDFSMTKMEVVSFKPDNSDWKLMLTGDMEGLAKAIQAAGK
ncbi:hypothetical protein GCM10027046_30350 [Uliginosibacterium flavum]|uniref:Uncharacterized protein n=1 Tax=Uliginosibacterium flavum TaxID=1396831 RepID=A0ABV2TGA6_9RHOO